MTNFEWFWLGVGATAVVEGIFVLGVILGAQIRESGKRTGMDQKEG